jgi:DNA-binding transcriptional LysR family regulator
VDSRTLDLNLLTALDVLLTERNVTRAARRLNISQPALSARLARLRDLLGDQLLIPVHRGMVPTRYAESLQDALHESIERVRAVVVERAPFDPAAAELTFSIAASDYAQYAALMLLQRALAREAPRVRLSWWPIDVRTVARELEHGDVDLAILKPELAPATARRSKLYHERYVVIARLGHPQVRGAIDLESFCSLDHAVTSPQPGSFEGATDLALAALGRTRRVTLSAPGFLIVPEIVASSDIIAVVPERIARGRADELQVLEPPLAIPGFDVLMLWHDRTANDPARLWLRERLSAVLNSA